MWSALSALHGETGLIPVLVPAGRGDDLEASCYDTAEVADVDRVDAAAILEHLWRETLPEPWQTGLPVLNWCPGNWSSACPVPTPVGFAAVLRSWEERFGARLLALTHDEAYLLVERPPRGLDAALPVAAEHFVFCDEPAGRQPVQTTAGKIADAPLWYFWWD